ncbi:tetratricopeptide repeat protein [Desulfobaculum sp. SPO524]|uniref:tetratricopeptide repeat protein n=1 Tax=Desulfobaculum sp. SPO524 TaxID=3378071 RepID=UPI0038522E9F
MFDTPDKRVREDFARAKSALHKGNIAKALLHAASGVRQMMSRKIFGRARFEVEVHLQEFLKDFNRHPEVKAFMRSKGVKAGPYVTFRRGTERQIFAFFVKTLEVLEAKEKEAEEDAEAKRAQRKKLLFAKAQQAFNKKEFPKGKSLLRHAIEEFGREEGVLREAGARMLKAGLYFEAGEVLEKALLLNPRDSKALAYAVQAYKNAREYPKMEKMYRYALRTFGSHPKTLLHMAEMYIEWRKYDEAYDYAKQAYDADKSLAKAKKIVELTEKRIFR